MQNASPALRPAEAPPFEVALSPDGSLRAVGREPIFQLIRDISDPEHPYTLEQLGIVELDRIYFIRHAVRSARTHEGRTERKVARVRSEDLSGDGEFIGPVFVVVEIVPTIPHCSLVSIIGLSIIWKLRQFLGEEYVVEAQISEDTHVSCQEINKQLRDRERTEAAFENEAILETIAACAIKSREA